MKPTQNNSANCFAGDSEDILQCEPVVDWKNNMLRAQEK